jgi:glycolate oxidase FAD binding subunit
MRTEYPASTAEAAELIAGTGDLAVLVRGAGTKPDWGPPPERCDLVIDTSRMAGVVEHAAGDLIAVVRAGTPLSELELPGQQLALDSPVPGATVGGTVAANVSGPRRLLYGTARDLLIGITVVRPDGTVAHAGGKVVKNVAGYDLGKLFIGSYGTLGLITECVFRLHPRPAAAAVVRAPVPAPADAGRLVAAVLAARVVPAAIEVDAPADGPAELAVLLEGTAGGVRERAAALAKLLAGTADDGPPDWWGRLPWRTGEAGLKLTAPLSRVPALLEAARGVAVRGSAGAGVLYAGLPAGPEVPTVVERLRGEATRAGGHLVVVTAPPEVRKVVDMWGPVGGLALMRRVKEQFDPGRRFAPGRFVGGI